MLENWAVIEQWAATLEWTPSVHILPFPYTLYLPNGPGQTQAFHVAGLQSACFGGVAIHGHYNVSHDSDMQRGASLSPLNSSVSPAIIATVFTLFRLPDS